MTETFTTTETFHAATFAYIPTDSITPSPYQMRKTFGGKEDEDLADSVQKHGVLQPIRVRRNGSPTTFELVFGERRWRAAQAAGLANLPAIVVDLADDQVIEQLLIENLKRRDVTPLDEGDGFKMLLDKCGITVDDLIARTGKSKAYVYGRLKLTELVTAGRKALQDGKLSAACAEMIARLDPKVQPECLKDALGLSDARDYEAHNLVPEGIGEEGKGYVESDGNQPLSFRALQALIHRKYTLRLETAPFPTFDAQLVPAAGACQDCPHRTGAQPELFPDLKKPADSCTKPSCFDAKVTANWKRSEDHHAALGHKIVKGKDGKALFNYDGTPTHHGEYVAADQEMPHDLARPGSKATWGKLLGKAIDQVPKVLVQDERGAARELLDRKAATKLLREAGKLDEASKSNAASKEAKEERAKSRAKHELRGEAFKRVLVSISQGAANVDLAGKKALPALRWLAQGILDNCKYGAEAAVAPLVPGRGHDNELAADRIAMAIRDAKSPGAVLAIAAALLVGGCSDAIVQEWKNQDEQEACFEDACKLFGADWDKALAAAKEAAKIEAKADAAKKTVKKGKAK